MERFLVLVSVIACFLLGCQGLELTIDRNVPQDSSGLATCGIVLCVEESHTSLPSTDPSDNSTLPQDASTISNLTIYRQDRSFTATINLQQPEISGMANGILVEGNLTNQQARLRLKLFNQEDCRAEFACQVEVVESGGSKVMKTSQLLYQPEVRTSDQGDIGGWTPTFALQILYVVQAMNANLSSIGQAVANLEHKLGQSQDNVGLLEGKMEDIQSTMDRLNNNLTLSIKSLEDQLSNKAEFNNQEQRGKNDSVLALISSFDSKIEQISDALLKNENNLQNSTNQCLSIMEDEMKDLKQRENTVLDTTKNNIEESIANFTRDISNQLNFGLDTVQRSVERELEQVAETVNRSAVNIELLLENKATVMESCQRGMTPILSQDSSYYTVIYPSEASAIKSPYLCDTYTNGGGWVVIQRRINGNVNFSRDWDAYKKGFGYLNEDFWLGNDNINKITSSGTYELRVEVQYDQQSAFAEYNNFFIGDEQNSYTLHVGAFSGTAGDSLSYHNGMKFSTFDEDNDASSENCADTYSGGWWFNHCLLSNLNGIWGATDDRHIYWYQFTTSGLTYTEMKIRRVN